MASRRTRVKPRKDGLITSDRMYEDLKAGVLEQIQAVHDGTSKALRNALDWCDKEVDDYLDLAVLKAEEEKAMIKQYVRERTKALKAELERKTKEVQEHARKELEDEQQFQKERYEHMTIESDETGFVNKRHARKKLRRRHDEGEEANGDAGPSGQAADDHHPDIIELQLSNECLNEDLAAMADSRPPSAAGKKKGKRAKSAASAASPRKRAKLLAKDGPEHSVKYISGVDDQLLYDKRPFYRGSKVNVEWKDGSDRKFMGIIMLMSPANIWLRNPDDERLCLQMAELRKGVFTLRHSQGKWGV